MTTAQTLLTIAVIAAGTMLTRFAPFLLLRGRENTKARAPDDPACVRDRVRRHGSDTGAQVDGRRQAAESEAARRRRGRDAAPRRQEPEMSTAALLPRLFERLAEALFRDFPGESGRTIRVR